MCVLDGYNLAVKSGLTVSMYGRFAASAAGVEGQSEVSAILIVCEFRWGVN